MTTVNRKVPKWVGVQRIAELAGVKQQTIRAWLNRGWPGVRWHRPEFPDGHKGNIRVDERSARTALGLEQETAEIPKVAD